MKIIDKSEYANLINSKLSLEESSKILDKYSPNEYIKSEKDVDDQEVPYRTVFMTLICENRIDLAIRLLTNREIKLDTNLPEKYRSITGEISEGNTPLFAAVAEGRADLVKLLLWNGAQPELAFYNEDGSLVTPIMYARKADNVIIIKLLEDAIKKTKVTDCSEEEGAKNVASGEVDGSGAVASASASASSASGAESGESSASSSDGAVEGDSLSDRSDSVIVDNNRKEASILYQEDEYMFELIVPRDANGSNDTNLTSHSESEYEEYLKAKQEAEFQLLEENNMARVQLLEGSMFEVEYIPGSVHNADAAASEESL